MGLAALLQRSHQVRGGRPPATHTRRCTQRQALRPDKCEPARADALLHFDVELVEIAEPGGWLKRLVSIAKALPFK